MSSIPGMSIPLRTGELLAGKYRIESRLGGGGMGIVLSAVNVGLDRRVAIKLLSDDAHHDEELVSRFIREGRAAARLRSEHVARVLDLGKLDSGQLYLVSERLEGSDLAQLIASSPKLEPAQVVDYVMQACDGLAEAHAAGIVHRDLKPANLFLTETVSGRPLVKILDFGICKLREERTSLTKANELLGTPRYMSPEQLAASHDVDERTDIWGLGVILYEMLAKKPPFDGVRLSELMTSIASHHPPALDEIRPDVSRDLAIVVERCLEKKKTDRFADVLELSFALAPHGLGRRPSTPLRLIDSTPSSDDGETQVRVPGENGTIRLSGSPIAAIARVEVDASSPAAGTPPPYTPPTLKSEGDSSPFGTHLAAPGAAPAESQPAFRRFGRYVMGGALATGGMALVHYGVARADDGTLAPVALKRLRAELNDPEYATMLTDEARIAGRVRHPNVVGTLDMVALEGEVMIVLEYVPGVSLGQALRAVRAGRGKVPVPIAAAIAVDVLRGLHAAHEAVDEQGHSLEIVHRDVSPQNILLDERGAARIADFGVASARGRLQRTTETGALKGKLGYLAPEQIQGVVSRAVDVYACGAVLWEMLAGRPLFQGSESELLAATLMGTIAAPSTVEPSVPPALDAVVLRALSRAPDDRHQNALELVEAIVAATPIATNEIARWLEDVATDEIQRRRAAVDRMLTAVVEQQAFENGIVLAPAVIPSATVTKRRPAANRGTKRRAGWIVVALGMVAVAAVAASVFTSSRDRGPATEPPTPPPSALGSAGASVTPPTTKDPEPAPSAPTATAGGIAVPRKPGIHPRPSRTATPTKTIDCTVPYVINAEGQKIWRRECFK
jgi:eukaryotic-like serine/threonine-protein kinase